MQGRMLQTVAGRDQGFMPNTPVMNQNHNEQWASRSWHTRQGGCSSEYLAVLLLAWGRKNPEGRFTSSSAPRTQYTQVLGNGKDCSTLPTMAITSGNHCGLVVGDRWNPDIFLKRSKMHLMMNKYLVLKMPLNQYAPAIPFVSYTDKCLNYKKLLVWSPLHQLYRSSLDF